MKYKININDPETYVECKICQKKFSMISSTHLKTHGITTDEYITKFNISKGELVSQSVRSGSAVTEKAMLEKYGVEEGTKRWNEYRRKQAETNTFEYKKKKYNWSEQQFKEYNSSRAVTKDNLVKRYGMVDGLKKWEDYIRKQAINGCTLEWFVDKLGLVEGEKKYREVNSKKRRNLETYIEKYGGEEGEQKYFDWRRKVTKDGLFTSEVSQELFKQIEKRRGPDHKTYFRHKNKEFGVWLHSMGKYTFMDFYDLGNNKCIEFYGDYWHCNPQIYAEDFKHPVTGRIAKDIRLSDKVRIESMEREYNIKTLVIWESDYRECPESIITDCLEFLNEN